MNKMDWHIECAIILGVFALLALIIMKGADATILGMIVAGLIGFLGGRKTNGHKGG